MCPTAPPSDERRQTRDLEAVGRLAAGLAHDFNNMMTIVTGYSELLLGQLDPDSTPHKLVGEIRKAGDRAAGLARQLLAFSRRQQSAFQTVDLNSFVPSLAPLLGQQLGPDVELALSLDPAAGSIRSDPRQLEQVFAELAANAREAMPKGGRLTIATRNLELPAAGEPAELRPGPYVLLTVADNGAGMTPETRQRLFEPFFTTKGSDAGGLGLANVYGIVKQAKGHIRVESAVGLGSTFFIYLPRVEERGAAPSATQRLAVLVVSADDELRRRVRAALPGHAVLEARSALEALRAAAQHRSDLHWLLLDLPPGDRSDLPGRFAPLFPGLRTLTFCASAEEVAARAAETQGRSLPKTFAGDELARVVTPG